LLDQSERTSGERSSVPDIERWMQEMRELIGGDPRELLEQHR